MNLPHMLVMRASSGGIIWQAYRVDNETERDIISSNAKANAFHVEIQPLGYTDETTPGWRNTKEWEECVGRRTNPEKYPENPIFEAFSRVSRQGPYWLGGYKDWLVCCYSVRNLEDMRGFTPVRCWSELIRTDKYPHGYCDQYLVCEKDGQTYVDHLRGIDHGRGFGLHPVLATEKTYPPHVYDWVFNNPPQ